MSRSSPPPAPAGAAALLAAWLLSLASPALAAEGPQLSGRLWAAPEGTALRDDSPYAAGAERVGLDETVGRAEAVLRLTRGGLALEGSLRATARRGGHLDATAVATEVYQELDLAGQHFTLGKKVTAWDVAFGFRPLDVVQQERRLALHPFALEGVPQLAWEWLDERWAVTVLWAEPLQGRRHLPVHDESAAVRVFRRLGPADLHLVGRWSERTGAQAGAGLAWVVADALELHGSVRWQERTERTPGPHRGAGGSPLPAQPPGPPSVSRDAVAGVAGFTWTPGLDLSILGEGWLDPGGDRPATWRARRRLAEEQRTLGRRGAAPAEAVSGNLAWGLAAFDRQSPLRANLLLRASLAAGRWAPALDWLVTPADRGWVLTTTCAWQGERVRLEGAVRVMGGPPGAAHRLHPSWITYHASVLRSF